MGVRWLLSRNTPVALCVVVCSLMAWSTAAQAASAPVVENESAYDVTLDASTVQAQLNPGESETTYRFEYGTSTAYGSSSPTPEGPAGSGSSAEIVEAQLKGLTAAAIYHYRIVATNNEGSVAGPDRTFRTYVATPATLPDERAYELVSPPSKDGGEIDGGVVPGDAEVPVQASEDGKAVTYASATSFDVLPGEAKGSAAASSYVSRRGLGGWSTQNVTPPSGATREPDITTVEASTVEAMAPDLSADFFVSNSTLLQGSFFGYATPYRFDMTTGSAQALMQSPPPDYEPNAPSLELFDPVYAGASSDFSHILFTANDRLTPQALGSSNFSRNLYEWAHGQLHLVNILPDGSVLSGEKQPMFGAVRNFEHFNVSHAISDDGSRIFWSDEADRELFARVDGASTVLVSRSRKTNGTGPGGTDPLGPQVPVYQGASANGSYVFFTSTEELTNDANTGNASSCVPLPGDCAADLYRYSMETGQLADLTADAPDTGGANVRGVLGSSDDGSRIYFVANGALASGASPGECREDIALGGLCNLYVWSESIGTRFIAGNFPGGELASGPIVNDVGHQSIDGIASENLLDRTSRVSPNGRFLAFQSRRSLTGYDNVVAQSSDCVGPNQFYDKFTPACPEVFLYDAEASTLVCASCNPTGGRPIGPSVLPFRVGAVLGHALRHRLGGSGWVTETYQQRYLDDSGRLFFDTQDALSPRDTNGQPDVYEYENGQARLISGGFGGEASMFLDAGASGDDAFFLTRDQLTSQDRDEAVDLYDARVGAQPDLAVPPPCASSDACKSGPTPQPTVFGAPASATFSGAGNVVAGAPPKVVQGKSVKKPKPKKKRKAKSKRKKVKKSHKSSMRKSNRRTR
jgi:hypothetical protein